MLFPSPESRVPSPESRVPSPESRSAGAVHDLPQAMVANVVVRHGRARARRLRFSSARKRGAARADAAARVSVGQRRRRVRAFAGGGVARAQGRGAGNARPGRCHDVGAGGGIFHAVADQQRFPAGRRIRSVFPRAVHGHRRQGRDGGADADHRPVARIRGRSDPVDRHRLRDHRDPAQPGARDDRRGDAQAGSGRPARRTGRTGRRAFGLNVAIRRDGFPRAPAEGELASVYLLAGEEPLLLQEAADAVRARARASGYGEREVLDVESGFDWNALARSAASLSLFASRRLIELRLPTGKPDRDGAAAITEWCESPAPDTVLLITAMQWSRKHEGAGGQEVRRAGVYQWLRAPRLDELPAWIRARMRARGFAPDDDAVALLASRAEGNLLAIAQEIDKLAMLREGGPVRAEELESLGADGEDLIPMLGWLLNQLDLALRLASAPDFATAARHEYNFWPARQRLFAGALKRAGRGPAHWERCLAWCARIDRMAKGREAGDPWREMERLLVAIAQPRCAEVLLQRAA